MKGLIHIYTGPGKGKTTAAMGLAARAAGYNWQIYILQFLKARTTGEKCTLQQLSGIVFKRASTSTKFTVQMTDTEREILKEEINSSWDKLKGEIKTGNYRLVILDEVMAAINNDLLSLSSVREFLLTRPEGVEIVLTGRGAPEELIALADYVTEMKLLKHPFANNIAARKGIEF